MATNYLNKSSLLFYNILSLSRNIQDKNLKDREKVDIVDKTGKVVGKATRNQVYKKGLLHPAVNIIVVNKKGQILIQKRSPKKIFPLYWDISASEHVKSGEDNKTAAIRGLKEELSIVSSVKLLREKHLQRNEYTTKEIYLIEYELVELYGAVYNGKIKLNHKEVSKSKFISIEELDKLLNTDQIKFTPWGFEEINYLLENPSVISELIH